MKYVTTFDFPVSLTVETTLHDALREACADYRAMGGRYPHYQRHQRTHIRALVSAIRAIRFAKVCMGEVEVVDHYVPILDRPRIINDPGTIRTTERQSS